MPNFHEKSQKSLKVFLRFFFADEKMPPTQGATTMRNQPSYFPSFFAKLMTMGMIANAFTTNLIAEDTDLKIKIPENKILHYQTISQLKNNKQEESATITFDFQEAFEKITDQKSSSLVTIQKVQFEGIGPDGVALLYRSDSTEPKDEFLDPVFKPLIDTQIRFVRSPDGKLLSYKSIQETPSDTYQSHEFQNFNALILLAQNWPQHHVKEGDSWESEVTLPFDVHQLIFKLAYQYEGEEQHGDKILQKVIFHRVSEENGNAPKFVDPDLNLSSSTEIQEASISGYILLDAEKHYPDTVFTRLPIKARLPHLDDAERILVTNHLRVLSEEKHSPDSPEDQIDSKKPKK